ncbi:MAG: peptidoglycan domain protein [Muribaculaceae bacterium]|nr:peptidoglycan domain protein [Muribaculaceae bacterium]
MAQIEKLIPFIIYFETGVSDVGVSSLPALFEKARARGVAYDPDDRGGLTMAGVTLATYKEYCRKKGLGATDAGKLRNLGYEEWRDILKTMFWDRWQADKIECQALAHMLVDWVWTSGSYGITIPQRALGVKADGIVGVRTLNAVNSGDAASNFTKMKQERIAYIERICRNRLPNRKFRSGWLRRVNAILIEN